VKLTRRQLSKLIREAFRYIVDDEGTAYPSDAAFRSGASKDAKSLGKHPKLDARKQSNNVADLRQARALALALDYQPELTDAEETAIEMGYSKTLGAHDSKVKAEHHPINAFNMAKKIERVCSLYDTECAVVIDTDDHDREDISKPVVIVTIKFPPNEKRSMEGEAQIYIWDHDENIAKSSVAIEIYGDYDRAHIDYDFTETKKYFNQDRLDDLALITFKSAARLVYLYNEQGLPI
jgi:hypothetical protein